MPVSSSTEYHPTSEHDAIAFECFKAGWQAHWRKSEPIDGPCAEPPDNVNDAFREFKRDVIAGRHERLKP